MPESTLNKTMLYQLSVSVWRNDGLRGHKQQTRLMITAHHKTRLKVKFQMLHYQQSIPLRIENLDHMTVNVWRLIAAYMYTRTQMSSWQLSYELEATWR